MKTRYIIIILGIIIASSIIFALMSQSTTLQEHYKIEITGMKDVYLVGEPYSFSYILSGYGYVCGGKNVHFPDQNGDSMAISSSSSCIAGVPMDEFVFDIQKEYGTTYGHVGVKNPRTYTVGVEFERSSNFEPTQASKTFHVVEKICDAQNSKEKTQCFADAFYSCTSAYIELVSPTGEGDGIFVTGVVESWNDCKLRVYTDHSQDRYKGDNDGTRSICDVIILDEESITFQNCNNVDLPPLRFDQQYYIHKEKCEIYDGYWNFEYNTCFDFSDDYDCETMGGELVNRAYTGEQPDYSKKSDSYTCMFKKSENK